MDSFYSKLNEIESKFYEACDDYVFKEAAKFKGKQAKGICLLCASLISMAAAIVFFLKGFSEPVLFVSVIVLFVFCFALYQCSVDFKTELKQKCFPKMIDAFENLHYLGVFDDREIMPDKKLKNSGVFTQNYDYNIRTCDDCFTGSFNSTKFNVCELELIKSGGKSSVTTFKGIAIEFHLKNQIEAPVRILTKAAKIDDNISFTLGLVVISLLVVIMIPLIGFMIFTSLDLDKGVGSFDMPMFFLEVFNIIMLLVLTGLMMFGIYSIIKWRIAKNNIPKLDLDDAYIGKKYLIYSQDKNVAYDLITRDFADLLDEIQKTFKTNKIRCSFFNHSLMLAISTRRDWFELGGIFGKLNDKRRTKEFFNVFSLICKIADYLNK